VTHLGGGVTISTASDIARVNMSGYLAGAGVTLQSGTFNQTSGDGFGAVNGTAPAVVQNYATGAVPVDLGGDASLVESSSVKSLTGSAASDSVYHRFGGEGNTVKLPANVDGWIGYKYQGAENAESTVGFNINSTVGSSGVPAVGFVCMPNGYVAVSGGTGGIVQYAHVIGSLYAIHVVGPEISLRVSTDMGASWTKLHTFAAVRNSALYVHAALYNTNTITFMQAVGLTA
jgi:hypothetical protein